MGNFKTRIQNLIAAGKTSKALQALNERARSINPSLEDDISILSSNYAKYERAFRLRLNSPAEIQNDLNRINDSVLQLAELLDGPEQIKTTAAEDEVDISQLLDSEPEQNGTELGMSRKRNVILISSIILIAALAFAFWKSFPTDNKCDEVKAKALATLNIVLERKQRNTDKYDEIRLLFLEGTLQNHINLTSCDSLDAIIRDINLTNNYLQSNE